jgi:hypothetical protein
MSQKSLRACEEQGYRNSSCLSRFSLSPVFDTRSTYKFHVIALLN